LKRVKLSEGGSKITTHCSSAMKTEDFQRIASRIREMTGIVLQEHKRVMVQTRVMDRIRSQGFKSFENYLDFLDQPQGQPELEYFCNALTTNLTSFFREIHHFEHFSQEINRLVNEEVDKLRFWSAGCSTGEEAYSMALLVSQMNFNELVPNTKILATDIDTNVLSAAKSSLFNDSSIKDIKNIDKRFIKRREEGGLFSFTSDVKDIISFKRLNLLNTWPMNGKFDVIFCRNVLIYFSAQTKTNLISRFVNKLNPNGVLYLGHSETILDEHPQLVNEGNTIYRKSIDQ